MSDTNLVRELRELALEANDPDARDEDRLMREAADEIELLNTWDTTEIIRAARAWRHAVSRNVTGLMAEEKALADAIDKHAESASRVNIPASRSPWRFGARMNGGRSNFVSFEPKDDDQSGPIT